MRQFLKILKFELTGHLKNKVFIGMTVVGVVLIALAIFFPNIKGLFKSDGAAEDTGDLPVMLIRTEDSAAGELTKQYFAKAFPDYNVTVADGSAEDVQKRVTSGEAECAFDIAGNSYTYYVNNLSMYDVNPDTAEGVLRDVYRINAMIQGGLSEDEAGEIMSVQIEGNVVSLGKDQMQNFFYTYIMIFALYMVILLYGQMVATDVASEKSSRAMEVLITSAKPTSMMFGKVLASCAAGLIQLAAIFGSALTFYHVNKAAWGGNEIINSIFNIPVGLFVYLLVFFFLGFLIYAFLYGAIGSTVSKLEDVNTSVMPVTFLFIIAFIVVVFSMTSGNVDSTVLKVCSFVPFTSPMAMFTRICMSSVPWYEIAVSIALLVGTTVGTGFISAKIYRVGVLLYGTRPNIKEVFKAARKA